MKFILFPLFLIAIAFSEFVYDGLNHLTQSNLQSMLSAHKHVLAVWYSPDCAKCGQELWEVNFSLYAFGDDQSYLIGASTLDEDKEMVEKYGIPDNHDSLEIRLFVAGNPTPLKRDEDEELIAWIAKNTGLEAQKDRSFHITEGNYNTFLTKSKGKNVMMFFYVSGDSNSQTLSLAFYQSARAFSGMRSIFFASVDCSRNRNICTYYGIRMVPELKLIPTKDIAFDDKTVDFQHGEQIDGYLNRYFGTFISLKGGLNERYGRDSVLDELAHEFMNGNEEERKQIMKKILKLKSKHPASFRYYKVMKMVMIDGDEAVDREKDETEKALANLPKEGKEYSKLRGMQNVLRQFIKITIEPGKVFVLDEDNFDAVVNGKRNVMVKFYAPWCGHCRALAPVYEEVAKENTEDVLIAELDADKYKTLAGKYGIEGFPILKWFAKGADPSMPEMVDSARTKESLLGYINEKLHGDEAVEEESAEL